MAVRSPSKRKVAGSIPAEALIFFQQKACSKEM